MVCRVAYQANGHSVNKKGTAGNDTVYVSCDVPLGSDQSLVVRVSFDQNFPKKTIRDVTITIISDNKLEFTLSDVEMYWYQLNPWMEKKYRKPAFADIPPGDRLTSINGNGVGYSFDYKSTQKIRSKNLNIAVMIQFEDGEKTLIQDDYKIKKSSGLKFH